MKRTITIIISIIVSYICLALLNNAIAWLFNIDPELLKPMPVYLKWYQGYLLYIECWTNIGWMHAPILYILPVFLTSYFAFIQFFGYVSCQLLFSKILNTEPAL